MSTNGDYIITKCDCYQEMNPALCGRHPTISTFRLRDLLQGGLVDRPSLLGTLIQNLLMWQSIIAMLLLVLGFAARVVIALLGWAVGEGTTDVAVYCGPQSRCPAIYQC